MKMKILLTLMVLLSTIYPIKNKIFAEQSDQELKYRQELMITKQLEARGIKDKRVIDAMRKVKRHLFVSEKYKDFAYDDKPFPIEEGQTISQPYIIALMTELLELKGNEKVLEIGTGSGYQAAILAELAAEVYTIEILKPLAARSKRLLDELEYKNIQSKTGDGYLGWPEHAPFNAIIVTCAPDKIPEPLIEQLADNARLVIPVGKLWQKLKLIRKVNNKIVTTDIIPVRFVPMLRKK